MYFMFANITCDIDFAVLIFKLWWSCHFEISKIKYHGKSRHVSYFRDKKVGVFSIGLNDIGSEGSYKWTDGNPYGQYLNWNTREPNDAVNQEDCVHLLKSINKWNDNHCSVKVSYICKSYNGKILCIFDRDVARQGGWP